MNKPVLPEPLEMRIGRHTYRYDPTSSDSPVLSIDRQTISVDKHGLEATYMICGCSDYRMRQEAFDRGETYQRQQRSETIEFGWDCVATCEHLRLARRYFATPFLEHVISVLKEKSENVVQDFSSSVEAQLFPEKALVVLGNYLNSRQK